MAKLRLNNKLCDEICNDIKAGVPIQHAAIAHGISAVTFYAWYNKGKKGTEEIFKNFYEKVEEAKSVAITLRARRIYKAGEKNWKADAWWLERTCPEHFGAKKEVKADVKVEDKHMGLARLFTEEELAEMKEDLKNNVDELIDEPLDDDFSEFE